MSSTGGEETTSKNDSASSDPAKDSGLLDPKKVCLRTN